MIEVFQLMIEGRDWNKEKDSEPENQEWELLN